MNLSTSVLTVPAKKTDYLSLLFNYAFANNFSVAFWRLPGSNLSNLIIAREAQYISSNSTIEELPSGFLFAPFDKNRNTIFLRADFKFCFENGDLKKDSNLIDQSPAHLLQEIEKDYDTRTKYTPYTGTSSGTKSTVEYTSLVNLSISEIEKGTFEKVVPSRAKWIELPANFDAIATFQTLCAHYPHALVSFVSTPEGGSWIGATPEVLVSVENRKIFKTVALAGTKPYHKGLNPKSVAWTQKEIEEQALVERYIISCFKKIRLREYDEHGPKTVVAGNLMHLKSDFTVDMLATNFPLLGSTMLQLLHPTSAVCGMPLEASLAFLKDNEGYDREFYAGYLGPVNFNNDINIFVNLRCMKLLDKAALLFAGAGVTIDSVAEEELYETEMKFETILKVIKQRKGCI